MGCPEGCAGSLDSGSTRTGLRQLQRHRYRERPGEDLLEVDGRLVLGPHIYGLRRVDSDDLELLGAFEGYESVPDGLAVAHQARDVRTRDVRGPAPLREAGSRDRAEPKSGDWRAGRPRRETASVTGVTPKLKMLIAVRYSAGSKGWSVPSVGPTSGTQVNFTL